MRVLVVAQASVQQNPGGAEVAAENLARGLSDCGFEVHLAFAVPFHFAKSTVRLNDGSVVKYAVPSEAKYPDFWNNSSYSVGLWRSLVAHVNPDIIHAHHFFGVGTNVVAEMCRAKPTVLTIHEYLAICHRDGQLVRRSGSLCRQPSEMDCLVCNNNSLADQGLSLIRARNTSFKLLLGLPRVLLAPSQFLKDRFTDWGVTEDRIHVIPNVLRDVGPDFRPQNLGVPKLLYLSSITKLKGAEILMEAACELSRRGYGPDSLEIEIWGTGDSRYIKDMIEPLLAKCAGMVRVRGRFERDDLDTVLARASAVICPSIWYENRPTVLDEAILRGIPIVASNIGGMKELATTFAGMTFRAGDPDDLANAIERFLSNRPPRQKPKYDPSLVLLNHIEIYERILELGIR